MLKYNAQVIKNLIYGKRKSAGSSLLGMKSRSATVYKYKITFNIRFPYRFINSENRYGFMPITLSLNMLGLKSDWNINNNTKYDIKLDNGDRMRSIFLLSFPFTIEKQNKSNVDYECRSIVVESETELFPFAIDDRISHDANAFELFNIVITKI